MSASNNVLKRGIRWNSAAAMNVEAKKDVLVIIGFVVSLSPVSSIDNKKQILSKLSQHDESLSRRQGEIQSCARHCEAPISPGEYNIDGYTNLTGRYHHESIEVVNQLRTTIQNSPAKHTRIITATTPLLVLLRWSHRHLRQCNKVNTRKETSITKLSRQKQLKTAVKTAAAAAAPPNPAPP